MLSLVDGVFCHCLLRCQQGKTAKLRYDDDLLYCSGNVEERNSAAEHINFKPTTSSLGYMLSTKGFSFIPTTACWNKQCLLTEALRYLTVLL